jgi:hypothetical protein
LALFILYLKTHFLLYLGGYCKSSCNPLIYFLNEFYKWSWYHLLIPLGHLWTNHQPFEFNLSFLYFYCRNCRFGSIHFIFQLYGFSLFKHSNFSKIFPCFILNFWAWVSKLDFILKKSLVESVIHQYLQIHLHHFNQAQKNYLFVINHHGYYLSLTDLCRWMLWRYSFW